MNAQRKQAMDKQTEKMLRDKERILMAVLHRLTMTYGIRGHQLTFSEGDAQIQGGFSPSSNAGIKPGDLVVCITSGIHPWTVGIAASEYDPHAGGLKVREIGSNRICDVSNDSFYRITGIHPDTFWTYDQNEFVGKVKKAYRKLSDWGHRYRGVEFDGETARIVIGEVHNGAMGPVTKPYYITLPWSPKTTIKAIVAAMEAQGYGTNTFEIDWEGWKRAVKDSMNNSVFCALHGKREKEIRRPHKDKHCEICYYLEHFGDTATTDSTLIRHRDTFRHQGIFDGESERGPYKYHLFTNLNLVESPHA